MSVLKWIGLLSVVAIGGVGLMYSNDKTEHQPPQSTATTNASVPVTGDDIVGQWRSVVENPAHPNTVARRYMRHTFFMDGELLVENEETASLSSNWQYDNGIFIVTRTSGSSDFIEHYRLNDRDNLEKILFQSIIDGEPLANYNPEDRFVRQGSGPESSMKIRDIFASANSAMDFIDPTTLTAGSSYTLSRETPIMPDYTLSDLAEVRLALPGQTIEIVKKKDVENTMWYRIQIEGRDGWINSIALFGQELNP